MMMTKSPSGALSPYYYKGGYFHGIHYGSYFTDSKSLFDMMQKEEAFILKSQQKRRILIDLYETELTQQVLVMLESHLMKLKNSIIKLAIATDGKSLKKLRKMVKQSKNLQEICCYFCTDMEEGKTWLVSDTN